MSDLVCGFQRVEMSSVQDHPVIDLLSLQRDSIEKINLGVVCIIMTVDVIVLCNLTY